VILAIRIAWRNLFRHQGKSLVIGSILFLGSFLLTIGNATISGMEKGLNRSVAEGFTGDVMLVSREQKEDNVLLGMMGQPVEEIHRFDTLRPHLESSGLFSHLLPVGKSFAMAINETGGTAGYAFLLGVDFAQWRKMFPRSLEVLYGHYPDSAGLLVSTGGLDQLYTTMGIWFWPAGYPIDTALLSNDARAAWPHLKTQSDIVFMGFNESNTTSDIRLNLDGISRFHSLNRIWGHFLFVDIEAFRRCMGLFQGSSATIQPSERDRLLLQSGHDDLEALFGDSAALGNEAKLEEYTDSVTSPSANRIGNVEAGAYHIILAHFASSLEQSAAQDSLNKFLELHPLPVRALTWQKASGAIGSMTLVIKIALNLFVFLLFIVAIIIIVNTLSMAALERTSEIGMMRAVGAPRSFITSMFLWETSFLSASCGALGITFGTLSVWIAQAMRITTDNDVLQLFFGGDTFHPVFGFADLGMTTIQLALVTILASAYPVAIAQSILPLDAITRD